MELEERQNVQQEFAGKARILISTDAGGEGLNLQFCHVVINYDLPWNPMRIEQRIGRVDRIGQRHPVKAFNFVLKDTIEYRVQEVLQEKLSIILKEFGVDKTSEILDSTDKGVDFERLYMDVLLVPEGIENKVSEFASKFKERVKQICKGKRFIPSHKQLDPQIARRIMEHPLPYWVEQMTTNYLSAKGGKVERSLFGYNLDWPDGTKMENVTFIREEAENYGLSHLTLEEPKIRGLVSGLPKFIPGQPIVKVILKDIPAEVMGFWSLWRIVLISELQRLQKIMPLFVTDKGKILWPTAWRLWDMLLDSQVVSEIKPAFWDEKAETIYWQMEQKAKSAGHILFQELLAKHKSWVEREREKGLYAFNMRKRALEKIGLPQVRNFRLKQLETEFKAWGKKMQKMAQILPELDCILILRIEG